MLDLLEHRFFADDSDSGEPGGKEGPTEDTGDDPLMNPDEPTA